MKPLCLKHAEQSEAWLFAKPTTIPAMQQIGGLSDSRVHRHAIEARTARAEDHAALVRRQRQAIADACAAGRGCTPTDEFGTPAMFEIEGAA